MLKNIRLALLLSFAVCIAGAVHAQSLPQPVSQNGIAYITGGVGEDEVQVFRAAASRYSLRLTFASKSGHYLSDVDVAIVSSTDQSILAVHTEGPFLFVRLPAGRYQVHARAERITETRGIRVPAHGGVDLHFYWNEPDNREVMQICKPCHGTAPR